MERCIIVFCTVPSPDVGIKIAEDLVSKEYAACVNIIPGLMSVYRWKGNVCRDNELLLVIKSRGSLFDAISSRIKAMHPYEVPEIICYDISGGSEPYMEWLLRNTIRL